MKASDISEQPAAPRQRLRTFLWLAGIALLVISIAPLYWVAIRWRASQRIEEEIARIRAAGEPTTYEEVIQAIPPLAPERDCTGLYQALFAEIQSDAYYDRAIAFPYVGENEEPVPPPGADWPGFAAAAEFIDSQQHLIAKLDQAAALGGECRFPTDATALAEGNSSSTTISRCRSAMRLLSLRSAVAAHRHDADGVFASLLAMSTLSQCLVAEPDNGSLLYRWSLDDFTGDEIGRTFAVVAMTDAQLAQLQHRLRSINYAPHLHSTFVGNRVFLLGAFRESDAWWWSQNPADIQAFLHASRSVCDTTDATDLFTSAFRLSRRSGEIKAQIGDTGGFQFTRLVIDDPLVDMIVQRELENRLLGVLLACERYRLAHGVCPTSVEQLVPDFLPAVPDPKYFHGPLRILQDGEDLVVYSVGEDGKDAGGLLMGRDTDVDDIGYRTNTWKRDYEAHLARQAEEAAKEASRDETEPIE